MRHFDEPIGSSEHLSPMKEHLSKYLVDKIRDARTFYKDGQAPPFFMDLATDDTIIEFPTDNLESIEPSDEDGKYLMHFKEEVVGHKGRTALITGLAVLACAGSIQVAKKIHSKKS